MLSLITSEDDKIVDSPPATSKGGYPYPPRIQMRLINNMLVFIDDLRCK